MMHEETKRIAEQPWNHIDEASAEYSKWLENVQNDDDVQRLAHLWKRSYQEGWYIDLIQYPLLKRLYEIAGVNPDLYLHLQAVATHTPWASLDEVDGKYLFEAFFFFPHYLLSLYERMLFLIYQGYSKKLILASIDDIVEQYPTETHISELKAYLISEGATLTAIPADLIGSVMQRRQSLYEERGLEFVGELEPK